MYTSVRKNIANKSYILSRLLVYRLYIEKRGKWNERERKIVTVEMKTHFFLEASDLRAICTVDGGARAQWTQPLGTGAEGPYRYNIMCVYFSPAAAERKVCETMGIRGPERYAVSGHGKELC